MSIVWSTVMECLIGARRRLLLENSSLATENSFDLSSADCFQNEMQLVVTDI